MQNPAMVGSSLHITKTSTERFLRHPGCCALSGPGDPAASPRSETTALTASTEGGKTSQASTLHFQFL